MPRLWRFSQFQPTIPCLSILFSCVMGDGRTQFLTEQNMQVRRLKIRRDELLALKQKAAS